MQIPKYALGYVIVMILSPLVWERQWSVTESSSEKAALEIWWTSQFGLLAFLLLFLVFSGFWRGFLGVLFVFVKRNTVLQIYN